jgi:hypothetical protein
MVCFIRTGKDRKKLAMFILQGVFIQFPNASIRPLSSRITTFSVDIETTKPYAYCAEHTARTDFPG